MNRDVTISSDRVNIAGFRALLEAVSSVCRRREIRFFVIGALARDLLLEHVHGMPAVRATQDVDVALAVSEWEQYRLAIDLNPFRSPETPDESILILLGAAVFSDAPNEPKIIALSMWDA